MLAEEITSLKKSLLEYAAHVENMIDKSIKGLVKKEKLKLIEVQEVDEPKANSLEIELEGRCTTILAKFQPTAVDLRTIMMIFLINNDLERLADHAVNVAESSLFLIERPFIKPFIDIPHMAQTTVKMVKDSIDAFTNDDPSLARQVCERDSEIDALREQIYRELITYMISDPSTIERALHVMRVSNNLERIADLSTNISEDVIYIVKGKLIKHHKNEG